MASDAITADGVALINQDIAQKGKIIEGDAPGFPVTITKPGSYRLSSNLTVPDENTTAIEVMTNNVTLDLNGFTISGPVVCSGTPLVCSPSGGTGIGVHTPLDVNVLRRNTGIMNGTITGMGSHGIFIRQGIVERVIVTNCGGVGLWAEHGGRLANNIVDSNGTWGILAGPSVILGNKVVGNALDGIVTNACSLRDNSVTDNGGVGIDSGDCTIVGNAIRDNISYGLYSPYGGDMSGYGNNEMINNNGGSGNPQVLGGIEIDTNVCGADTICP